MVDVHRLHQCHKKSFGKELKVEDTDYGHPERDFFQKSQTFGLGQTFWTEIF